MTPRYPIPADAIPGLLGGWTGPATLPDGEPVVVLPGEHWGGRTLCGDGVLRHYTERSIRLDPARPEVAHRIADVLRSLGHEVRALLPRALGGEQGETVEVLPGDPDPAAMFGRALPIRRTVPASEVSAALLAASVAGVVAGRGVVRGVLGEWKDPECATVQPAKWPSGDYASRCCTSSDMRLECGSLIVGRHTYKPGWWLRKNDLGRRGPILAEGPETGTEGMAAADAAALALGWARLYRSAPSGVVVPTWGQP